MLVQLEMSNWLTLIEAEYREMPGLQLTGRQMQRLWGLDYQTCEAIVEALVRRGVLCETSRHAYALKSTYNGRDTNGSSTGVSSERQPSQSGLYRLIRSMTRGK